MGHITPNSVRVRRRLKALDEAGLLHKNGGNAYTRLC